MKIHISRPLFAWDELEDSPTLDTIRRCLAAIPDERLLAELRRRRHNGNDTYPVSILWGCLLLAILLRHTTIQACLDELARNPALRVLIGIETEQAVPHGWNMTRFLKVLGESRYRTLVRDCFDGMVRRLASAVDSLGRHTAGDSTGLRARPNKDAAALASDTAEGLPQPSGGRKEYTDDKGTVTKIVEWFGFKLHLLVDVRHEITLAYHVTDTKTGDNECIPDLVHAAQANLSPGRLKTLAYDKAADDSAVHEFLHEEGIKPVIQNRTFEVAEDEKSVGGRIPLHVVHDQAGTIFCYDTMSDPPVRRPMAYIGHEPSRQTLKYRCPARHEGSVCASEAKCNAGKSYGLTVRVPQSIDLRRFPPIPRATPQFERLYKGRTAVERVNGRLKMFWGLDDGNVVGSCRFHAHVDAVMVVHLALATVLASLPRYEGSKGAMRLGPIAKQLTLTMKPAG